VYDVTDFLPLHPAGEKSIVKYAGTDSTQHYDFHRGRAQEMWSKYEVGILYGQQDAGCSIM